MSCLEVAKVIPQKISYFYLEYKEAISRILIKTSKYNILINSWLYLNLPKSGNNCTKEKFTNHINFLNSFSITDQEIDDFFKYASEFWKDLENSTFENMKTVCLKIVAYSISNGMSSFALSLFEIMSNLAKRNIQLEQFEVYCYLVQKFDENVWAQSKLCRQKTLEYYNFAKRFLYLDFPIRMNYTIPNLVVELLNDKISTITDRYMSLLEKKIDSLLPEGFYLEKCHVDYVNASLVDRCNGLILRLKYFKNLKLDQIIKEARTNQFYTKFNDYLKLEMKIENTLYMLEQGNKVLQKNILSPAQTLVNWGYENFEDKLRVYIKLIKENITWSNISSIIKENSVICKKAVTNFTQGLLEIRISHSDLRNCISQFWREIYQIMVEIRNFESEDAILLASVLYQQALNTLKLKKQRVSIENN